MKSEFQVGDIVEWVEPDSLLSAVGERYEVRGLREGRRPGVYLKGLNGWHYDFRVRLVSRAEEAGEEEPRELLKAVLARADDAQFTITGSVSNSSVWICINGFACTPELAREIADRIHDARWFVQGRSK